jgi:hypothetical protein
MFRAVCWPGIPERKEEIERRCREYYKQIEPRIPVEMKNFIVDFAILEDKDEMTIVEFNDFADFEGAGSNAELFDWNTDRDILTGCESASFTTRLVMAPLSREQLEKTLTKPFRIHLGWDPIESWNYGVDWY